MRPRKIIAMIMTFLMMLSLLPSLVFAAAAPEGELGGQLKIKGTAAVGSELSADYEKGYTGRTYRRLCNVQLVKKKLEISLLK